MKLNREELIQVRAHEIWESHGRPEGRAREHWEQASREIDEAASAVVSDDAAEIAGSAAFDDQPALIATKPAKAKAPAKRTRKQSA